MDPTDDDLTRFAAEGAQLPEPTQAGYVDHDGAKIWHATFGAGRPVVLLHGGLGHSGNWGYQVPALVAAGHQVVVIDSRGHGRSTRDDRPYTYALMAGDLLAVLDHLRLARAALVGWSDGAVIALIAAERLPKRVAGVFFFGCNVDPSGAKDPLDFTPVVGRCFNRHVQDYAALSATPGDFEAFSEAVGLMQRTQPNYTLGDLVQIGVPVTVAHSEHDEFIKPEHAAYLAASLPFANYVALPGVSHFAPLQRPELFNHAVLTFLTRVWAE